MPGTYALDASPQNDVPHIAGAKSNIYLPPSTPTASATSSLYLFDGQSTASVDMIGGVTTIVGRKRMRDSSLPYGFSHNRENQFEEADPSMTPGSPRPFVSEKYRMAGGLDTPQADIQNRDLGRESDFGDVKYRRELSDVKEDVLEDASNQLYRDENGRARIRGNPKPIQNNGWIAPVFNVFGGVVGKVWEFCKMGVAFKGFQAGGGNGYEFGSSTPIEPIFTDDPKDNMWDGEGEREREGGKEKSPGTPVPGGYPMGGMVENYMDQHYNPLPDEEATPPAKRRQTSFITTPGADDMSRNWVVVPPQPQQTQQYPMMPPVPREAFTNSGSPAPRSRFSTQRSGIARYNNPSSLSGRRQLVSPSIASSNMSASRKSAYQSNNNPRILNPSPNLSNTQCSTPPRSSTPSGLPRTASPASSRIPRWTPNGNSPKTGSGSSSGAMMNESPAAREAREWKAKQLKEEREQDEMIRKFNRQLNDLIKQGNQALGTTVADMEVDEEEL